MLKGKKLFSYFCILILLCGLYTTSAFAASDGAEVISANEGTNSLLKIPEVDYGEIPEYQVFEDINNTKDSTLKMSAVPENLPITRDAWKIVDPIFVGGSSTLAESVDYYFVSVPDDKLTFLKLNSNNNNILALLYKVKEGNVIESTGWGVYANNGIVLGNLKAGEYVILIGSASGNERGNYQLMWNCSNPSNASYLIDVSSDLSRTMVYYDLNNLYCNGDNILNGVKFKEDETTYLSHGYIATSMDLTVMPDTKNGRPAARGIFTASFSSSQPYSTSRALFINVNSGSWCYYNSTYSDVEGKVHHTIDYSDLSGLKTPRTFGTGANDFSYGPNYLVIDLNTYEVVDFVSPFNFNYNNGRTYTIGDRTPVA